MYTLIKKKKKAREATERKSKYEGREGRKGEQRETGAGEMEQRNICNARRDR